MGGGKREKLETTADNAKLLACLFFFVGVANFSPVRRACRRRAVVLRTDRALPEYRRSFLAARNIIVRMVVLAQNEILERQRARWSSGNSDGLFARNVRSHSSKFCAQRYVCSFVSRVSVGGCWSLGHFHVFQLIWFYFHRRTGRVFLSATAHRKLQYMQRLFGWEWVVITYWRLCLLLAGGTSFDASGLLVVCRAKESKFCCDIDVLCWLGLTRTFPSILFRRD